MRKRIVMAFVLALALAVFPASALAQSSVTVYTNWSLDHVEGMRAAFKAAHPEVDITFFRAPIEELFTILDLEMQIGQARADVVIFGDPMRVEMFKERGWLEPLNISDDILEKLDPALRDPSGFSAPYMIQPVTVQYSTRYFSDGNAPTSWADLLDDRFKGRIAMGDPKTTGMVHVPMWFIIEHLGGKVGEPFGWSYFERLAELDTKLIGGHRTIRDLVAVGEIAIAIQTLDNAVQSVAEGEPTGYTYLKEGTPALYQSVGIIKGSRNLQAARTFTEWLLGDDGQRAVNQVVGVLPVRSGVEIEVGETIDEIGKYGPIIMVGPELTPECRAEQAERYYELRNRYGR